MGVRAIRNSFFKFPRARRVSTKYKSISPNVALPTELWLDIIFYLSPESIEALSLTCSSLRFIAQPLLFQNQIKIHPFVTSVAYRRLELASYVARSMERLDFLSSLRIAHHIRNISLTPYPRGHSLSRSGAPHMPEDQIIDRIFNILPSLSNLRILILHSIKSTPQRMEVLSNLRLEVLELETRNDDTTWHGNGQPDQLPTPIATEYKFLFNCDASPHQNPLSILVPLRFIYPDSIVEISSGPNGTESILTAIGLSPTLFLSLSLLDLSVRFASTPAFITALQQCPNLASLRLRSAATDSPAHARPTITPLPPDVVPNLTSYHGPPSLAPFFAGRRCLYDVKLWSSRSISSITKPAYLAPILPQLGTHIKSLEIGVTTVPPFLIETLQNSFPNLKSLSVNAHLASYHPGIAETRTIHTQFTPIIDASILGNHKYDLDVLSFGAQLTDTIVARSSAHELAAQEALSSFPRDYDPTSWGRWSIESPWSKVMWRRLDKEDQFTGTPRGQLSIEYDEYIRPVFRT